MKLGKLSGRKGNLFSFLRPEGNLLAENHIFNFPAHLHRFGIGEEFSRSKETEISAWLVSGNAVGYHLRINYSYAVCKLDPYILPYSDIPVAYSGYPVPSFRRNKGRTIKAKLSAIRTRSRQGRFFLGDSRIWRRKNMDCQNILPVFFQQGSDIEISPAECAGHFSGQFSIQPDVSFIINTIQ